VLGFRELVNLGIIHRDLKPANILVNSKGEFKLADFGFAKFVDHYDSKLLYSIVGTPLYMSPQILNKTQYTTKSDIWSLGFILYEMLTGTYPWMGTSEANLYKNIMTRPLNIPNTVSAYSRDVLSKMLKPN
jgi:calcium-dependent protein kinase